MKPLKSITLTRIFHAPRKLVFEAWLDEKHLAVWWSPRGFTNPVCKVDGKVGGNMLIHMSHPDFGEMPMTGKYEEITPIDKIVFTTGAFPDSNGTPQLQGHNTVVFTDAGKDKTQIVLTAAIMKAGPELQRAMEGMDEGWNETLDRLGELVDDTRDREFGAERTLDAPVELVWKVWSEPEHIAQWWGPNGFRNTIHKMEFRQGGDWNYMMHGPDGTDYPNHVHYLEIIKHRSMIYDHGSPEDPGQFRVYVKFRPEGKKTHVSMRGVFRTTAQLKEAVEKFGAREGLEQNFDRMVAYVKKMQA